MTKSRVLYSEEEAAEMLGVSVSDLRLLVRKHILQDPSEQATMVIYQASDLLLLRVLAGMAPKAAAAGV